MSETPRQAYDSDSWACIDEQAECGFKFPLYRGFWGELCAAKKRRRFRETHLPRRYPDNNSKRVCREVERR